MLSQQQKKQKKVCNVNLFAALFSLLCITYCSSGSGTCGTTAPRSTPVNRYEPQTGSTVVSRKTGPNLGNSSFVFWWVDPVVVP